MDRVMTSEANRGFTYRERIPAGTTGTLLAYLVARYPHGTETEWRERIRAGRVRLEGRHAAPETPLRAGVLLTWERPPWVEPPAPRTFALLHEDEHLLAVAKPAGLPTLPGGGYLEQTLLALVRRRWPEAAPAHRLGRWTSGVALFARGERSRAGLARALREGAVHKRYRALASGRPHRTRWTVDVPIGPVPHVLLGSVHGASPAGRPSRSEVHVLEGRADAFLADVVIVTGRPHQIRIHLAAAGHPLVGDPLYAPGGRPLEGTRALPGDPGYLLHAAEIRLDHPGGKGELRVTCAPPPVLRYEDA
jgi:23S rRNA pseudouridine1911/1915/1917 synthase